MKSPVDALLALRENHSIYITPNQSFSMERLRSAELRIQQSSWTILIDDEYDDLKEESQLMCLYLILRELEIYQSETDFLTWCNQNGSNAANSMLLQYYKDLGKTTLEIESILGSIDSQITDLDYQLRTGIIEELIAAG